MTIPPFPHWGSGSRCFHGSKLACLQLYGPIIFSNGCLMFFTGQLDVYALYFNFIGYKIILKCFLLDSFMAKYLSPSNVSVKFVLVWIWSGSGRLSAKLLSHYTLTLASERSVKPRDCKVINSFCTVGYYLFVANISPFPIHGPKFQKQGLNAKREPDFYIHSAQV